MQYGKLRETTTLGDEGARGEEAPHETAASEAVTDTEQTSDKDTKRLCCCCKSTRWVVITFLCFANVVCYVDRTNISIAMPDMSEEFGWDSERQGEVLSSFFWGYICTQILGAWLAARIGGKPVLLCGVILWSLFTILTPFAAKFSFEALLAVRVAMGLSEGVTMPAIHSMIGRWVPVDERSRATAFITSGQFLGTVVADLSSPLLAWSWEVIFYLYGGASLIWAGLFYYYCASTPSEHRSISQTELKAIHESLELTDGEEQPPVTAKLLCTIFRATPFWTCVVAHVAFNYGWYVMISWLPSYFSDRGIPTEVIGFWVLVPHLTMFLLDNTWGHFADWLIKRGTTSLLCTRKLSQAVAFLVPSALFLFLCTDTVNSIGGVLAIQAVGFGFMTTSHSGFWPNLVDFGPRYAGLLCGISNTIATVPGIVGTWITGTILGDEEPRNWSGVFWVQIVIWVVGAVVYLALARTHVIFDPRCADGSSGRKTTDEDGVELVEPAGVDVLR